MQKPSKLISGGRVGIFPQTCTSVECQSFLRSESGMFALRLAFLLVPGLIQAYGWQATFFARVEVAESKKVGERNEPVRMTGAAEQVSFFGFGALALLWLPPWLLQDVPSGRWGKRSAVELPVGCQMASLRFRSVNP